MPKTHPRELRRRVIELSDAILTLRELRSDPRPLECGIAPPAIWHEVLASTQNTLEAELILVAEEIGIVNDLQPAARLEPALGADAQ